MGALLTSTDPSARAEGDRSGEDRADLDATPSDAPTRPLPRWALPLAAVFAVAPLFTAAIRNGLAHWTPTWDAATTTVRINDVFTRHPPLIGMAAFPSRFSDSLYSFPGALEQYLLAVPVRLLGTTWGLLLGMATLNTIWVLLIIWLVRRRAGDLAAVVACVLVASLLWTAGSQVIIDPTPMQIGIIPFLLLLVAAWSVADGDAPALLVLAVVGNYLVLDQLKFTLSAPTLGVFALAMRHGYLRRVRRDDPDRWPEVQAHQLHWLLCALAFTIVVWLPPLYQQLNSDHGNLGALISGSTGNLTNGHGTGQPHSLLGALGAVVATTVVPPLWLRPTFHNPTFDSSGGGTPFLVGAACLLAVATALARSRGAAKRRGDRTTTTAIATLLVGWLVCLVTTRLSPDQDGYTPMYLHALWPLSVFVWLVVAIAVLRRWPRVDAALRRPVPAGALVGVVALFAALNVPLANFGAGTPDGTVAAARSLDPQIRASVHGNGPVLLRTDGDVARRLLPTVMLDLQEMGIDFRVESAFDVQQFGDQRRFGPHDISAAQVLLISVDGRTPVGYTRVATAAPLWSVEPATFAEYDHKVRSWMRAQTELHVADGVTNEPTRIDQANATLAAAVYDSTAAGTDVRGQLRPHQAARESCRRAGPLVGQGAGDDVGAGAPLGPCEALRTGRGGHRVLGADLGAALGSGATP